MRVCAARSAERLAAPIMPESEWAELMSCLRYAEYDNEFGQRALTHGVRSEKRCTQTEKTGVNKWWFRSSRCLCSQSEQKT